MDGWLKTVLSSNNADVRSILSTIFQHISQLLNQWTRPQSAAIDVSRAA